MVTSSTSWARSGKTKIRLASTTSLSSSTTSRSRSGLGLAASAGLRQRSVHPLRTNIRSDCDPVLPSILRGRNGQHTRTVRTVCAGSATASQRAACRQPYSQASWFGVARSRVREIDALRPASVHVQCCRAWVFARSGIRTTPCAARGLRCLTDQVCFAGRLLL